MTPGQINRAADGLFRKTWPSQPDNWEMKPRNRDCKSANADCQAAIPIAARQTPIVRLQLQPVIDVRNPHVVRTADYLEVIEHLGGLNLGDPEDRLG